MISFIFPLYSIMVLTILFFSVIYFILFESKIELLLYYVLFYIMNMMIYGTAHML